jgi:hypothetical protein
MAPPCAGSRYELWRARINASRPQRRAAAAASGRSVRPNDWAWRIGPSSRHLLLTFMFGPAGLLVSNAQRTAWHLVHKSRPAAQFNAAFRLPDWMRASKPRLPCAGLVMLATVARQSGRRWRRPLWPNLFDDRLFGGEAIWLKPLRFSMSLSIYMIMLAIFYPLAGEAFRTARLGKFVAWAVIVPSFLEGALQAARGVGSHYNVSTAIYAALYGMMRFDSDRVGAHGTRSRQRHRARHTQRSAAGCVCPCRHDRPCFDCCTGRDRGHVHVRHAKSFRADRAGRRRFATLRLVAHHRRSARVALLRHSCPADDPIFGLVAARVLSAPAGRIAVSALYVGLFIATLTEAIAGFPILPS